MPITHYLCSKCRREFNNFKSAKVCENAHIKPVSAKAIEYTIRPYPYSLEVVFDNGEKRIYNAQDLGG